VLIGDRRKFLTALIVPNFEKLERDAAALGVKWSTRQELVGNEKVKAMFQSELDRFNQNLDRQEKIRRFALLPTTSPSTPTRSRRRSRSSARSSTKSTKM
jgi:long-chain acyl-CoA synthetase